MSSSPAPSQYLRDLRIRHEYDQLAGSKLGGLYVLPDWEDILLLHGVVFPRQAAFSGAVFKFKIDLPADYPHSPPVVTFLRPVFHPLVEKEVTAARFGAISAATTEFIPSLLADQ